MAGFRKGARGQGLSATAAIAAKGIRPEPSDWNMLIAKAGPLGPVQRPSNFARDSSPDDGGSPGRVIKEG